MTASIFLRSLLFFIIHFIIPKAKAQLNDYYSNCTSSSQYTKNSTYQTNLNYLFSTLPYNASNTGFYATSAGETPNTVYSIYLCQPDTDNNRCNQCVHDATTHIFQDCLYPKQAVTWNADCMIRFSNNPIFRTMEVFPTSVIWNFQNVTGPNYTQRYGEVLNDTMVSLVSLVSSAPGLYRTTERVLWGPERLYASGQCTPDLNTEQCEECLRNATGEFDWSKITYVGGKILKPSCTVRFEFQLYPYYNNTVNITFLTSYANTSHHLGPLETQIGKKGSSSHIAVAVTVPLLVVALLLVCSFYFFKCYRKRQKASEALVTSNFESIATAESLQFDFRTIREATNNFSDDNKLGAGGFGVVYKGSISYGQEIAVKRLSTTSGQGISEFKTEVVLIARLQHKNLVRLLGYCLWKDEKLLVYEFLPNSSLDKVLLDPSKTISLDWETRYKIIAGIARGLLYLHEDSRLKVIHRDLKSSNILLDERMNPKISDFGLARLVGTNQIQAGTNRIVGTYGYMAPEYAMTGRFSAKSDVYSFGVIVLEIISGHKCNSMVFPYEQESVTERAWSLWNENKSLELVDSRLEGKFSKHEVAICIHIGLLCLQEDTNMRPAMDSIVAALNGHHVDFPPPAGPHLIQSTNPSSTTQSSSSFSGSKKITELHTR